MLPGGFIGVDVFFVISGFLISTILYSNLEAGRFSIFEFYGRRIRRIFPALILVMAAIAQRQGIAYLSPRQYLCNESGCLAVLVTSETLSPVKTYSYTAFDLAHLTSKGSRYLVGQFPSK